MPSTKDSPAVESQQPLLAGASAGEIHDAAVWLAAIVENSDDAILSKTLEGIITSWNPGAARLFGFTASEAIGQPITIVISPRSFPSAARSKRDAQVGNSGSSSS